MSGSNKTYLAGRRPCATSLLHGLRRLRRLRPPGDALREEGKLVEDAFDLGECGLERPNLLAEPPRHCRQLLHAVVHRVHAGEAALDRGPGLAAATGTAHGHAADLPGEVHNAAQVLCERHGEREAAPLLHLLQAEELAVLAEGPVDQGLRKLFQGAAEETLAKPRVLGDHIPVDLDGILRALLEESLRLPVVLSVKCVDRILGPLDHVARALHHLLALLIEGVVTGLDLPKRPQVDDRGLALHRSCRLGSFDRAGGIFRYAGLRGGAGGCLRGGSPLQSEVDLV
mmetsp:Transcript_59884/g.178184  ORF Transcript_59884/g.178184 Transcript_59884/m.178184 type:complete len:285 (+) Transcript_59884:30-884(+)